MDARSITGMLALLSACAFANPLAQTSDGASTSVRIGIAAANFRGDCDSGDRCSVQLSFAHAGKGKRRVDVTAVRVIAEGVDLGPLPIAAVGRWRDGAYRDARLDLDGFATAKVSITIATIEWESRLRRHGIADLSPALTVEVDLQIDDERVLVRSMFTVPWNPEPVFIIT